MLFPLRPDELIEVLKRRTGVTWAEVAARMGWKPGRLDSYLHRLRTGRPPTREEIDLLATALADPRHVLTDEIVIRNQLHASSGIEPTPREVGDFLDENFPDVIDDDAGLSFLLDTRWFMRWVSPALRRLVALLSPYDEDQLTALAHGWAAPYDDIPDIFAVAPGTPTRPPLHLIEVLTDENLGLHMVLDHPGNADGLPGEPPLLVENQLRYLGALWPDLQSTTWFAPIHQRLIRYPSYAKAWQQSTLPRSAEPQVHGLREIMANGSIGSKAGSLAYVFQEPLYDRRFGLSRILT